MAAMRTEPQLNTVMGTWHCLYHVIFVYIMWVKWSLKLNLM